MYLKSVHICNYASFGEDIKIEFDSHKQILLIGTSDSEGCDSNGSGKTNFASAIFWCLLGVPIFDEMLSDDVIRYGETSCKVEIEIVDDNTLLKICRERNLNSNNSLEFYINGQLINQKTNVSSEVQKEINKYFGFKGTQKQIILDILSTNFLSYSSVDMFVSKRYSSSERFAYLSRMFDLDKWIECKEIAHSYFIEYSKQAEILKGKKEVYEKQLNSINVEDLSKEIPKLNEQLKINEENIKKYSTVESTIALYKSQIQNITSSLEILNRKFALYKEDKQIEILNLKNKLQEVDKLILKCSTETQITSEEVEKLEEYISEEKVLSQKLILLSNLLKEYLAIKQTPMYCPKCNASLFQKENILIEYDKTKIELEINKFKNEISDTENNINLLNSKINAIKNYLISSEKLIKLTSEKQVLLESLETISNKLDVEYSNYEKEKWNLNLELKNLQSKIDTIYKDKDIEYKLSSLKTENIDIINRIEFCKNSIKEYSKLIKEKKEIEEEIEKLNKKITSYKFWEKAFPEIRRLIIQSILPKLEELSNNYLKEMSTSFEIFLDTLREYKTSKNLKEEFNIKVYDKSTETILPIYLRSTGERKRIGIAVCMALLDLKSLNSNKSLNFRFFDEVLDNLDSSGIEFFLQVLNKDNCQNIVISHNDLLKHRFNKVIKITKRNGVSYV